MRTKSNVTSAVVKRARSVFIEGHNPNAIVNWPFIPVKILEGTTHTKIITMKVTSSGLSLVLISSLQVPRLASGAAASKNCEYWVSTMIKNLFVIVVLQKGPKKRAWQGNCRNPYHTPVFFKSDPIPVFSRKMSHTVFLVAPWGLFIDATKKALRLVSRSADDAGPRNTPWAYLVLHLGSFHVSHADTRVGHLLLLTSEIFFQCSTGAFFNL